MTCVRCAFLLNQSHAAVVPIDLIDPTEYCIGMDRSWLCGFDPGCKDMLLVAALGLLPAGGRLPSPACAEARRESTISLVVRGIAIRAAGVRGCRATKHAESARASGLLLPSSMAIAISALGPGEGRVLRAEAPPPRVTQRRCGRGRARGKALGGHVKGRPARFRLPDTPCERGGCTGQGAPADVGGHGCDDRAAGDSVRRPEHPPAG